MSDATTAAELHYRLDAKDHILSVGRGWESFARENDAEDLERDDIVGQPLWRFIRGAEVQSIYRAVFEAVRARGSTVSLPMRCDSPSQRRYMQLRVEPGPDGELEICSRLERTASRVYLAVLDVALPRRLPQVEICSFCKRLFVRGRGWLEADEAVGQLGAFTADEPPRLVESVCEDCVVTCVERLGEARSG